METKTPTKTYKDVEAEIESQYLFAKEARDTVDFKKKGGFLFEMGFSNSITTKMYRELADAGNIIAKYEAAYHKRYKFILESQLELVCGKYNLYLRGLMHFLGEIPKKNVSDMMECYIAQVHVTGMRDSDAIENMRRRGFKVFFNDRFTTFNGTDDSSGTIEGRYLTNGMAAFPLTAFTSSLFIAAVKPMFSEDAFKESQARIIKKAEREAKFQVELDPIVLCKVEGGFLIITAWGDEANDELVANHNFN